MGTTQTTKTPATPREALRIVRVITAGLVVSPLLLWAVGWMVTDGGRAPIGAPGPGLTPGLALALWAALALGGFAGALFFRGRALSVVDEARRSGGAEAVFARGAEVQTALIIAMALLEGPALFAGVLFLLWGEVGFLLYSAPLFLIGVALVFPRGDWFGVDPRRA